MYSERGLPWKGEFAELREVNRDDDIETDAGLIKDTKANMKLDLEKQINEYLWQKK